MANTQTQQRQTSEAEGPDPLDQLVDLLEEAESHAERIQGLDVKEADVFMELKDTVMSLFVDSQRAVVDAIVDIREGMEEFNEALDEIQNREPGTPDESFLTTEDAKLFEECLVAFKGTLEQAMEQAKTVEHGEEALKTLEPLAAKNDEALARLAQIREEEEEPDEPEEKANGKAKT